MYVCLFSDYYFSCANFGHMSMDCKVVDRYKHQGSSPPNELSRYTHSFNGYFFLCANYGHMAKDCEVSRRYNYYQKILRSKFEGS